MSNPTVLRAERLSAAGFAHAFSTRHGGVSAAPYDSLNLGRAVGDVLEHVHENTRRFATAAALDAARIFETSQVHGRAVVTVDGHEDPALVRPREADALVSRTPGAAVGVRTADCVPVLLGDVRTGHVAAAHAGWRGVVDNVVLATIETMQSTSGDLVAAIGPSIGPCCFEVGEEVASQLANVGGEHVVHRDRGPKPHVDLWLAVEAQLRAAGVRVVDTLGRCTVCEAEHFFSYRRDGQKSGRMLSAIAAR